MNLHLLLRTVREEPPYSLTAPPPLFFDEITPALLRPFFRGVFTSILVVCLGGCDFSFSRNSTGTAPLTSIESESREIRYQGGYVFADREHIVGIDVNRWGLDSESEVRDVVSSCECVRASLIHLE